MTQHSLTTRLDHYINTMLPEAHARQRKAFRDFVTALLVVRSCCQATWARFLAPLPVWRRWRRSNFSPAWGDHYAQDY